MPSRRTFIQQSALAAASAAIPFSNVFAQSKATQFTYIGWSQDEAASKSVLTEIFTQFGKDHPDEKLNVIGFPWAQMQQNIQLRLRSNQPLQVVQLAERWLPSFAQTGRLIDLGTIFPKSDLEKSIHPGILKLGEYGGKQMAMPWTAGSIGMVANGKVLRDVGIDRLPITVADFRTALMAIKKARPDSVPYAMMTKNNGSMSPEFQTWLWTFGGRLLDDKGNVTVNSASGVRALSFMVDLLKDSLAARDIDRPDARRMFGQRQTVFYNDAPLARGFARNNSGIGSKFDSEVLAMPTPVFTRGDIPQSFAWGHLLALVNDNKSSPSKLNARSPQVEFVKYLALNDSNQLKYFKDQGLFPVTTTALNSLSGDQYVTNWSAQARMAKRDELSFWANAADLTTIVGEEVQAALLQQKTPQQAIEAMAKRMEPRMAEVRKA